MVRSMTGFGRGEVLEDDKKFTVEMKAVNHRYFDVNIRMPKSLGMFDARIRSCLKSRLQRGKIDVFITCEDNSAAAAHLRYNAALAEQYVKYYREIASAFSLEDDLRASVIGRCPEVFSLGDPGDDELELWPVLEKALDIAISQMVEIREREGEALKDDILSKLSSMKENVAFIEERYPQIIREYSDRIRDKVKELLGDVQIDESRLASELVIFSDRLCTDEETVRLMSHIGSMEKELSSGDGVGRKLDFIAQEMNREANTILSKANDLETSNAAIDLKTQIEKIREQIQNIE